ncbi:hypothetical protein HK102_000619 [Quaeritorhiza haematococci]|nr:hypothetical protein HK102_000619 [Quaeritorhiza haematococci]
MRSIISNCRSLEALRLESQGEEFEEDCLELVSRLGGKLKYPDFGPSTFNVHANNLIDRVADSCPNLERVGIPYIVELYVPNPPPEQQEGEEGQQPQPQQNTTNNVTGSEVRQESFAKLLRQCPHLHSLTLFDELEWSRFTDHELEAQVEDLVDDRRFTDPIQKNLDYTFYSSR